MLKETLAKFWAKAVKQYRVVMYDQESLSQSRNFTVKPVSIATLVAGVSLLLIAGTTVLIFSVPAIITVTIEGKHKAPEGERSV